jgi:hypothetical protein
LSLSSQKYGFWIRDPGSEIRGPRSGIWKKSLLDPGSRGQKPDPGSATLETSVPDPDMVEWIPYIINLPPRSVILKFQNQILFYINKDQDKVHIDKRKSRNKLFTMYGI